MKTRIIHHCEMFDRVIVFGQSNAADFAAGSAGALRFANLGAINTKLTAAGARQKGISVAAQNALIKKLEGTLQNIARTARAIGQEEPGFDDLFPALDHYGPHEVLATAERYLVSLAEEDDDDAATKAAKAARVAKFTAHEMPATFVADMQSALDDIGSAKGTHTDSQEKGAGNTAFIEQLVRDGMKEFNFLDAIVRNKYAGDAEKLGAWETASHIERDAVHAQPAPAPVTATSK